MLGVTINGGRKTYVPINNIDDKSVDYRHVTLSKDQFKKMLKRDLGLETDEEKKERIRKQKIKENKLRNDYLTHRLALKERKRRRMNNNFR